MRAQSCYRRACRNAVDCVLLRWRWYLAEWWYSHWCLQLSETTRVVAKELLVEASCWVKSGPKTQVKTLTWSSLSCKTRMQKEKMAADESWDAVTKDSSDAVELGAWHWGLCLLSRDSLKRCASSVRGFWGSLNSIIIDSADAVNCTHELMLVSCKVWYSGVSLLPCERPYWVLLCGCCWSEWISSVCASYTQPK